MIGKLRGVVDSAGTDHAVIDVGGVGYEVACPSRLLAVLPRPGEAVTLSIETHVREDAIRLYGFANDAERGWFRLLQSVQGVGAKVALSILGILDGASLARAIALQDKAAIARAPGVGPKVALRVVTELKDKAPPGALAVAPAIALAGANGAESGPSPGTASTVHDAVSALVNLGYAPVQANAAITQALSKSGAGANIEELIRFGLKELAR